MEAVNLTDVFDNYIAKFLDNFPFVEVEKQKIGKNEIILTVIVKEDNSEYFIHCKKVK